MATANHIESTGIDATGRLGPITSTNTSSQPELTGSVIMSGSTSSRSSKLNSQSSQESHGSPGRTLNPVRVPPNLIHAKDDSNLSYEDRRQSCFETLLAQRYINHATHRHSKLTPSLSEGLRSVSKRPTPIDDHYVTSAQFIESVRRELVQL
ncbi:unnamed protein product [Toxocara canis]|uniref:Cnn_1N domain-containing protein n=2 Tax=Toxocara canis TaxID=6265 RepID=A0A183UHP2_TOXCA|nr:unnamed protein product [Toxocara canis]